MKKGNYYVRYQHMKTGEVGANNFVGLVETRNHLLSLGYKILGYVRFVH